MARTNPNHDWPETETVAPKSNGAEWESLRNELVALLDQVEDHVTSAKPDTTQPQAVTPRPMAHQASRHSEALKSVRQAVYRLADRSSDDRPVMRESVVDAINQIRARQTGAVNVPEPEPTVVEPTPAIAEPAREPQPTPPAARDDAELSGLAQSLDALGERIGNFESSVADRLDTLDNRADISGQISQLSEVIEMLAAAVGETGQIRRIEAQIGNLAEILAADRASGETATSRRIEELTGTVEKLVAHQVEISDRDQEALAASEARQTQSMEMIERSVRTIYDRIDAFEASQAEPAYVERLSQDMASLTEAVSANREPTALLEKIDALSQRIETMQASGGEEAETLAQSVETLRHVIAETIAPRFDAIDTRIDAIASTPAGGTSDAVETQLRQIALRIEDTSNQLKAMSEASHGETSLPPDLDALAERIIAKANELAPFADHEGAGIDKADLAALEERLANLFARAEPAEAASHLAGVKQSINQVDNRIARLEAMLNTKIEKSEPVTAIATPVSEAPPKPRQRPDDAMPVDPVTGSTRRVLSQPIESLPEVVPLSLQPADEPKGFMIDPEAIERPAKPMSSFSQSRSPFEAAARETETPAAQGVSSATRSSFIEAARRSARQPEPEALESKSLIGRALARFQRAEAEATETGPAEPFLAVPEAIEQPAVQPEAFGTSEEPTPGFLARNRRALLLGTALIVAIALAVPLILDRQATATTESVQAIEPVVETPIPAAEPEAAPVEPAAPVSAEPETLETGSADGLTSAVRVIEQQPSLTAARVDAATINALPYLDPIQTASIDTASPLPTDDGAARAIETMTSAALPEIAVPDGIEPAELAAAAEAGDRFAQFEIGAILTEGTLVEQDFAQAAAWYERSAAQGFAPAQYRLGSLYESGRGVERDLEMARLWYQRAAEAGNRMSMHNLASLYAGGELETQDFESAAHWFEEAATRGMTDSQFNLGMLHARGLGVEQDFEQSYVWFSLAARAGDQDAATSRDDVARSLDAAAVQRLDDTIAAWSPAEFDLAANFAPIGTWDETFDPGPSIANTDVVLRVQMLLGKLGYEIGTPDGIAGPRTREAIASFERETGMSESGAVNPRLLAVLGSQPV